MSEQPFTESTLLERIALGEHSRQQFKHTFNSPEALAAELAAFADSGGGTLLNGVDDDGTLAGLGAAAAKGILQRADATKDHMGLITWKDAPQGKVQKFDVVVAKNHLTPDEMAQLQRLVSAYLDVAEDMALRQIPMTMRDWETRLNRFIAATDREILQDAGKVSAEIAQAHAISEFEKYRVAQDRLYVSDFDAAVQKLEHDGP